METEIWKEIKGYDGIYEISNLGRLRRINKRGYKIIHGTKSPKGYLIAHISNGNAKRVKIHRLVAMAFISNPDNKPQVNHINSKKEDNRSINLEWCTNDENMKHAAINGMLNGRKNNLKKK